MDGMSPLLLDEYDYLPDALATVSARNLRTVFPNSALIRLEGRRKQPLALGVMLHGDEVVGLAVLKRLQAWMKDHPLPRSLLIFVGNVFAAEAGVRKLPDRPDYNRIWQGGPEPEHALGQKVLAAIDEAQPFAHVDLHNNTGANPHYCCVHNERPDTLQLASFLSPLAMYTHNPPTMFSNSRAETIPAVTAECGQPGEVDGEEAAFNLVMAALHLDHFRGAPDLDLTVYEVTGRIEIAPDASFAFEHGASADLELPPKLENWNFFERPEGSTFARRLTGRQVMTVYDDDRNDVTARFFRIDGDRVILTRTATPAMLTMSEAAIRADCLGYLMEKRGG
jgi:hypothetical protein